MGAKSRKIGVRDVTGQMAACDYADLGDLHSDSPGEVRGEDAALGTSDFAKPLFTEDFSTVRSETKG